ncbi:MAG: hypothetical protein KGI14_02700 [Acidobacteriota bacterium]|nr:hypothetical protein [Acidobacteriota bacterium]
MKITSRSQTTFDRFAGATEVPMMVLGILWIPVLEISFFTSLPASTNHVFLVLDTIFWLVFAVEYLIKLVLAPARGTFVRRHLLDLIVIALPLLRPLRGLQVLRLLSIARAGAVSWKVLEQLREVVDRKRYPVVLALVTSALLIGVVVENS